MTVYIHSPGETSTQVGSFGYDPHEQIIFQLKIPEICHLLVTVELRWAYYLMVALILCELHKTIHK